MWHGPAVPVCPQTFPLLEVQQKCCGDAGPSQFDPERSSGNSALRQLALPACYADHEKTG
jgi:hypothetical protein